MCATTWAQLKAFFSPSSPAPTASGDQAATASRPGTVAPEPEPPIELATVAVEPEPPLEPTLEILGRPRDGKTSFIWALHFMLRRLSWVWPQYLCWSDEETEKQIRQELMAVQLRRLPDQNAGMGGRSYRLMLKEMERWGDRPLVLVDDRAGPFGEAEPGAAGREINWGASICWLLSLADLDAIDAQLVDVQLTDLVRARLRSARSIEAEPLKLVIALNKADRLPNLPDSLRRYLKADPIAAVVEAEGQLKAEGVGQGDPARRFDDQAVALYLERMWEVHDELAAWLSRSLAGHLLARRAAEHQLEMRFCLVSATGSDLTANGQLAIPWSPRRVLDPLFWALELESS
jgi:hypothetical protein